MISCTCSPTCMHTSQIKIHRSFNFTYFNIIVWIEIINLSFNVSKLWNVRKFGVMQAVYANSNPIVANTCSRKRNSTTDFDTASSTGRPLSHTCQYFCRPAEKCSLAWKPILSNRTPWQRAGTLDISNNAISAAWIDWGRLALLNVAYWLCFRVWV